MSVMSYAYEERLCRICGGYDPEYRDGHYVLLPTSIRRYAHPHCMVKKFGKKEALAMLQHDWHRPQFLKALRYPIQQGKRHPLATALRNGVR